MLNFHKPSIDDYNWIHDILYPANLPGADNTFHNMYFWECYYGEVAEVCGHVTQRLSQNGVSTYLYPAGNGDVRPALDEIMQDAKQRGEKFCLRGVTDDRKALLESLYPGKFTFTAYRDSYDYIYTVEELTELHGKKLQAKRNHCNRFEAAYPDYRVLPLTADQLPRCRAFTDEWYRLHFLENDPADYALEQRAIGLAFDHFDALGMTGLVLEVEGEVVAFAMGNPIRPDMFDVNFEKARADMNGPYPMINREFARRIAQEQPQYRFLNREDDMGLAGLRRAKESYIPDLLLEKLLAEELPA